MPRPVLEPCIAAIRAARRAEVVVVDASHAAAAGAGQQGGDSVARVAAEAFEVFGAGRIDRDEGRLLAEREVGEDAVEDQGVQADVRSERRIGALRPTSRSSTR